MTKVLTGDTKGYLFGYGGLRHSILSVFIQRILITTQLYLIYMFSATYLRGEDHESAHELAIFNRANKNSYFRTFMILYPLTNLVISIDNFIIFVHRPNHRLLLSTSVYNLLLVILDYLFIFIYWDIDHYDTTPLHKFARVLCLVFYVVSIGLMICTAEKNLSFEHRSWHVVLNKLPCLWLPAMSISFLVRLDISLYSTLYLDDFIYLNNFLGASFVLLFIG